MISGSSGRRADEDVMACVQIAIETSIRRLESEPWRDVLLQDFQVIEEMDFPAGGTQQTPAHNYADFRFYHYAPIAFRYFRQLFGICASEYLRSLCSEPLRPLTNPGRSGSLLYASADDNFIIKSVQHGEAMFLARLMPGYYMNLNQNARSLLPKFFGLYTYANRWNRVRLIVMNNILPACHMPIHLKFDLKGSTYGRSASDHEKLKNNPTLKDNDFLELFAQGALRVKPETYHSLIRTIERDCLVLQSFSIMDYSMLIGLHRLGKSERSNSLSLRPNALFLTTMGSIAPPPPPSTFQTGHLAAPADILSGGILATDFRGERVVAFLGIIDILQSYGVRKRIEHALKSVFVSTDPETISVTDPKLYAKRFLTFFKTRVFQPLPTSPLSHRLPFPQHFSLRRPLANDHSSQSTVNTIRSMPPQSSRLPPSTTTTKHINVYSTKL